MDAYKVLAIKQSVFDDNDQQADLPRTELKKEQTFLLNLMSSPGSGKTTTVLRTIEALKDEMTIGIMEADIDRMWMPRPLLGRVIKSSSCTPGGCVIWMLI